MTSLGGLQVALKSEILYCVVQVTLIVPRCILSVNTWSLSDL